MAEKLFLCKAELRQADEAMEMIEAGRSFLKSQGLEQWQTGYPDRESILQDIECSKGFFLTNGNELMAYMCLDTDGEPAYRDIKGQWVTQQDGKYMVIHRLAFSAAFRGRGLAKEVFALAEEKCREMQIGSIRADTDPDNKIMRAALKKAGFLYCGTIWFANGDKAAYEKITE